MVCALALSACLALVAPASIIAATDPVEEFPVPTVYRGGMGEIAAGTEGSMWFLQQDYYQFSNIGGVIERISSNGFVTGSFSTSYWVIPTDIARGWDGNMWYTNEANYRVAPSTVSRITPTGRVTEFPIPNTEASGAKSVGITAGAEDTMWFTEQVLASRGTSFIGRLTADGTVNEFPIPTGAQIDRADVSVPVAIALGADGDMWFTDSGHNMAGENLIGRVTPAGEVREFPIPTPNSNPVAIALGADGNMWFTEFGASKIGRITPSGHITEFAAPGVGGALNGITLAPDGDMWFTGTEVSPGLSWITPAGEVHSIPADLTDGDNVASVATGDEGDVWFTDPKPSQPERSTYSFIGRLATPLLPVDQALPTLAGEAMAGSLLTASQGTWTQEPSEFSYQWLSCDASGAACGDIAGARAETYFLQGSDIAHTVRVMVTASDLAGSESSVSGPSPVVRGAPEGRSGGTVIPEVHRLPVLGVTMTWLLPSVGGTGTLVTALLAHDLKAGTIVDITCKGRGCPLAHLRFTARSGHRTCKGGRCPSALPVLVHGELDLAALFAGRRLRPDARLVVRFMSPGSIGRAYFFSVRRRQTSVRQACLAAGSDTAESSC